MSYLNKCMFIGNVGRDPQVKTTANGGTMVSFSVAVSESYRTKDGEKSSNTTWVPCVAFGKIADVIRNLVCKGTHVYVEGKLNISSFTDESGNKKSNTSINVSSLQVLGGFKNDLEGDSYDDGELSF